MESFQRTILHKVHPPRKGKADAKVTTSGHILQISGDFFFRAPREPEGSFPKAGAKVGLISANAKLTGNFLGSFLNGKAQSTGKLGVRNAKKAKGGGKGERTYTIYNIITREEGGGGTEPGWQRYNAKLVAVQCQDGSGTAPGR